MVQLSESHRASVVVRTRRKPGKNWVFLADPGSTNCAVVRDSLMRKGEGAWTSRRSRSVEWIARNTVHLLENRGVVPAVEISADVFRHEQVGGGEPTLLSPSDRNRVSNVGASSSRE